MNTTIDLDTRLPRGEYRFEFPKCVICGCNPSQPEYWITSNTCLCMDCHRVRNEIHELALLGYGERSFNDEQKRWMAAWTAPQIEDHARKREIALLLGPGSHVVEGVRFWVRALDFGKGPVLRAASL